jgi:hypothetical protein
MRHGSAARRMRHRNNGGNPNQGQQSQNGQRRGYQNKNRVFDSNGPDVRIRGTAFQIVEKYTGLAKDAHSAGDRVLAESYLQHAEHYQRMINIWAEEAQNDEGYEADPTPYERFAVPPPAGSDQPQSTQPAPAVEEDLGLPPSLLQRKTIPATEMAE